jgi:hypothetical protein
MSPGIGLKKAFSGIPLAKLRSVNSLIKLLDADFAFGITLADKKKLSIQAIIETAITGMISLLMPAPHANSASISLSLERRKNPISIPNNVAIGNTRAQNVGSTRITNLPSSAGFIAAVSRVSKRGNRLPSNKRMLSAQKENKKGKVISLKSILDNIDIGFHKKKLNYDSAEKIHVICEICGLNPNQFIIPSIPQFLNSNQSFNQSCPNGKDGINNYQAIPAACFLKISFSEKLCPIV